MKKISTLIIFSLILLTKVNAQKARTEILLNGVVPFEQTKTSCPPNKFTRKIRVPGLIDLAQPKIKQYENYFTGTQKPRYSWYKFSFIVPNSIKNRFSVLKILKSRYGTQVLLNGHDMGEFIQNNTPIRCNLTPFLQYGKTNTLLVRVGERNWLSNKAATGFDREEFAEIPGIWDNVSLIITGPITIKNALVLPQLADTSVTVKIMLENLAKLLERNMEYSFINYNLDIYIREKSSKKTVSDTLHFSGKMQCQQVGELILHLPLNSLKLWSPEHPFLYEAVISINATGKFYDDYGNPENIRPKNDYPWIGASDKQVFTFGMRSFKNKGKIFELNGKEYRFFGSTIALNRFFDDPSRSYLPWDTVWVKKLLVTIPKSLGWNFFRIHIGLLPDFWYQLADQYGFLIQNEYPMWNLRGRKVGYKKEYTDWVWSDGNHPSIVIWDALNEQKEDYIGNVLIPELKKLDPTRIWDAGFMDAGELKNKEMEEFHWYPLAFGWWYNDSLTYLNRRKFRFGDLSQPVEGLKDLYKVSTPVIVNEFGWLWQCRNGLTSSIRTYGQFRKNTITPFKKNYEYYEPNGSQLYGVRDLYQYYLGSDANNVRLRRDFQAYLTAIEIETIRATGEVAGIASFAYLTNNCGYTGDWFKTPIKKLIPSKTLIMQYYAMRPFAAFLDLPDGRYLKQAIKYKPGQKLNINILLVNDNRENKKGLLTIKIIDRSGITVSKKSISVSIEKLWHKNIPVTLNLPDKAGGYAVVASLKEDISEKHPQISVRYIKIGKTKKYSFPEIKYKRPKNWPEN